MEEHRLHSQLLAHISQHWHLVGGGLIKFASSKSWNSNCRLHSDVFRQYSIIAFEMFCWSHGFQNRLTYDSSSSRPAHPISCTYMSISCDGPQWMICRTQGQSRPMPNATVAITNMRLLNGLTNAATMAFFTCGSVHFGNISPNLYLTKFTSPAVLVKCVPSCYRKREYMRDTSSYLQQ